MRGLQSRDLEILRTLVRLRYLTTRQINGAFFSCERVGRRRLQKLSSLNLIVPHKKGLPPLWPYSVWRLTARGIDAVADALPNELIPDGLAERVAEGSLYNLDHRDALAHLYVQVVVPLRDHLPEKGRMLEHRRWATELRRRGGEIEWRPDGDVKLGYSLIGKTYEVIPDATMVARGQRLRIFVELDRSTKPLGRIRAQLEQYKHLLGVYARHYPDGYTPRVLFAARSEARAANIQKLAGEVFFRDRPWKVLAADRAAEWLRMKLLPAHEPRFPAAGPDDPPLRRAAIDAYEWCRKLLTDHRGQLEVGLEESTPGLVRDGQQRMRALYDALANRGATNDGG